MSVAATRSARSRVSSAVRPGEPGVAQDAHAVGRRPEQPGPGQGPGRPVRHRQRRRLVAHGRERPSVGRLAAAGSVVEPASAIASSNAGDRQRPSFAVEPEPRSTPRKSLGLG